MHLQPTSLPHPLARPAATHDNRGSRVVAVSRGSRALPVTKPARENQRMSLRAGQRRFQQQCPAATSRVAFTMTSMAAAGAAGRVNEEAVAARATKTNPSRGGGKSKAMNGKKSTGALLTCESPLCNKTSSFAHRGQTRRRLCKRHAWPGMQNVYYKYCDADSGRCPERASYESAGKLRCLEHCEPEMRPRNNICQVEGGGCDRQSSFGVKGGKPILCTLHKGAGMVQVRTKTCRHPGCEKTPSYGFSCKSRECCKPHALEGMVYNAGRRCRFRGCAAPGAFNYPGVTRGGSFCDDHKEVYTLYFLVCSSVWQEGMVDNTPTQCEAEGCNYSASFGDMGQRTRRFCARHKLAGMLSYQELWATQTDASSPPKTTAASAAATAAAAGMVHLSAAAPATASATYTAAERVEGIDPLADGHGPIGAESGAAESAPVSVGERSRGNQGAATTASADAVGAGVGGAGCSADCAVANFGAVSDAPT
ncbi:unnamed protein product [Ectocarpus sp. CCAP 1310/34]|nr:unnamed protein product [Ectocarpus sp. CCAP 1310/34]